MIRFLDELKSLNLPAGKFVIFGSGPLAARNIRGNDDLDILVSCDLWDELVRKYPVIKKRERPDSIYLGNVQILRVDYKDWGICLPNANVLIDDMEMIKGFPFVKLKYLLICKELMNREKDKEDVGLIRNLLNKK